MALQRAWLGGHVPCAAALTLPGRSLITAPSRVARSRAVALQPSYSYLKIIKSGRKLRQINARSKNEAEI